MSEICPKCNHDGSGRFNAHREQLNPDNPNKWICGKCSEAFK